MLPWLPCQGEITYHFTPTTADLKSQNCPVFVFMALIALSRQSHKCEKSRQPNKRNKRDQRKQPHCLLFDRLCLINEHDGDVISDFVHELTFITDESVLFFIEINVAFAFGARQDIQ
jgi:hypothetical protein